MDYKIKPLLLVLILLTTTAAGVILKYFELPAYFIILGFRFHLSCVIPFLFIIRKIPFERIKGYFISPEYKKQTVQLFWIFIPLLGTAALYFTGMVELTDPDYFYEFGLSSIIDYPLYLVWNFLQLSMLFIFLKAVQLSWWNQVLPMTGIIILLFSYEAVPLDISNFDYFSLAVLFLTALSAALIIRYFSNVYWFIISVFTFLWSSLLLFGTKSSTAVNLIFAAKYSEWEGFLTAGKAYNDYLVPGYTAVFLFLIVITSLVEKHSARKMKVTPTDF